MELVKEKWRKKDAVELRQYLETFQNEKKIIWTQRIVNTNRELLAIKMPVLKEIAKKIKQGNYLSFLDLDLTLYYENVLLNGLLISQIADFKVMERYLDRYVKQIDNWGACDVLSFKVKNHLQEE